MAFTSSANDTQNIRMGTCVVLYDGIELGYTIGGVEVEMASTTKEIKVDQFGDTVANEYIMGRTCTAKCPMAETSIKLIADTMPGTRFYETGGQKVEITSGTGVSLLETAKELVLRPVALHNSGINPDKSEDFVMHKASAPGALSFAYKHDQERVFNLEFKGFPRPDGVMVTYGLPEATT